MQRRSFLACTILEAICASPVSSMAFDERPNKVPTTITPSVPVLETTINLRAISWNASASQLAFSRDGNLLAMLIVPQLGESRIVVWNIEKNKKQAEIPCAFNYAMTPFGWYSLLWNVDGTVISFGAKKQWNALTGSELPDNPAIGRQASFNKNGTKLLTVVGAMGETYVAHVYDTRTWEKRELYMDGLSIEVAKWTNQDKIIMTLSTNLRSKGTLIHGHIAEAFDVNVRLIDLDNSESELSRWFPRVETGDAKWPYNFGISPAAIADMNIGKNESLLTTGQKLDASTLQITDQSSSTFRNSLDGIVDSIFGASGERIYAKGGIYKYGGHVPVPNKIIDANNGEVLLTFEGGMHGFRGLAVDDKESRLAVNSDHSVLIFKLR